MPLYVLSQAVAFPVAGMKVTQALLKNTPQLLLDKTMPIESVKVSVE